MNSKSVSVVITTFNRCDDLRSTCEQLAKLDPAPIEFVVILDGCTDESKTMLAKEYPKWHVIENSSPLGSIPSRDTAFREARGDLILILDDDSYPIATDFVHRITTLFDQHPEIGLATFPELRDNNYYAGTDRRPESRQSYIRDFAYCAAVLRRDLYGEIASHVREFSHAYAESDISLQLYNAGYAVMFEPSLIIRHHYTPRLRNMLSRHHLNARNELWSCLIRCPFPIVVAMAPMRILRQFLLAVSKGPSWVIREPIWWVRTLKGLPTCWRYRSPVCRRTYTTWLSMARKPINETSQLLDAFESIRNRLDSQS